MTQRDGYWRIPKGTPKNVIITKTGRKIIVAGKVTKTEKETLEKLGQRD